jgi:hypothetical protein
MKTKLIVILVLSAIVTLSFTFASVKKTEDKVETTQSQNEPAGGFASEDKF